MAGEKEAAGISAGGAVVGSLIQTGFSYYAMKEQQRENAKLRALQIRLANEESEREMYRFNTTNKENKRQFGVTMGLNRDKMAQDESQFARSHLLQKDSLDVNKKELYAKNKMAVRENFQNLIANNHAMRLNLTKVRMGLARGNA